MDEPLTELLTRTHSVLMAFAAKCGDDADRADQLLRNALEGLCGQITDRAAQVEAWMFRASYGATPEEEATMRAGCAEFLRMVRRD